MDLILRIRGEIKLLKWFVYKESNKEKKKKRSKCYFDQQKKYNEKHE